MISPEHPRDHTTMTAISPTHTVPEKAGNNAADDDDAICQTTSPSQSQFRIPTNVPTCIRPGKEPQKVNLRHPKSHVPQHRSYHCMECMQRWDRAVGEDGARWGWRDTVGREMDRSVSHINHGRGMMWSGLKSERLDWTRCDKQVKAKRRDLPVPKRVVCLAFL